MTIALANGLVAVVDQNNVLQGAFFGAGALQNAVEFADPGQRVVVGAGAYAENLVIDKPLEFVAATNAAPGSVDIEPVSGVAVRLAAGIDGAVSFDGVDLSDGGSSASGVIVAPGAGAALTLSNMSITGFSTYGLFSTDDGAPATTPGLTALTVNDVVFDDNGEGGAQNTAHVKLFGFDGDASFTDVTFRGADAGAEIADRPDSAIEITGVINTNGNANPAPADPPAIGAVVLDGVTVEGSYHKNPVAFFHFSDLAGLSIDGLDFTDATSSWKLLNIDGVTAGTIDASGFGITFPASPTAFPDPASFLVELQGEKDGQAGAPIDQTIVGTGAADVLNGKEGDDVLIGGAGADAYVGGAGSDVAVIGDAGGGAVDPADYDVSGLTVAAGAAEDVIVGPDGPEALIGIEAIRVDGAAGATFIVAPGMSIQAAIDAATAGDTVLLLDGAHAGGAIVDKPLTIVGQSEDGAIIRGADLQGTRGLIVRADGVTIENLTIRDFEYGVLVDQDADDLAITSVSSISHVVTAASGVIIESAGIWINNGANVDGLTISDSHFDGSSYGMYFQNSLTTNESTLTNVSITNTSLNDNAVKGLYAEKLSNATLDNLEVINSGNLNAVPTVGSTFFAGILAGIDINLKYGEFENIAITNSQFTDSGRYLQNINGGSNDLAAALTVKARDDGAAYGPNPATLTGLTITGNTFESTGTVDGTRTEVGLRFGETNQDNGAFGGTVIVSGNEFNAIDTPYADETIGTLTPQAVFDDNTFVGTQNNVDRSAPRELGDNLIVGDDADQTFTGGDGDDLIVGGDGVDTAVYEGNLADYTVTQVFDGEGNVIGFSAVSGPDGDDTLLSIERLAFDDATLSADDPVRLLDDQGDFVASFATIQAAVEAAEDGYTIRVGAGTYREQVLVDGFDGLTIEAVGGVTIEMPDTPAFNHLVADGGSRDRAAVVTVRDSSDVTIEGFTIDGRGRGDAMPAGTQADIEGVLFFDASGAIVDNTVTGVRDALNGDGTPKGNQRGNAIVAINDDGAERALEISGNTTEDFQKNGITASGLGLTAAITGNTVTGSGFLPASNAIAQNGIQVSFGAGGVVDGNTVSELGLQRTDAVASYILAFNAAEGVQVTNNTIQGVDDPAGTAGIYVSNADGAVVTGNQIDSILFGVTFASGFDDPTVTGNVFTNPVASLTPLIGNSNPPTLASEPFIGTNYGVYGEDNTVGLIFSASEGVDEVFGTDLADQLSGLGGDDTLGGGEGDDTLDGGEGDDAAVFDGAVADHQIAFTRGAGATVASFDTVVDTAGAGGTDTLTNVERLVFDDATINVADPVFLLDDGGLIVGSFAAIQAAIDAASDGFTVLVSAGTYVEDLSVPVGVTIEGANAGLAGNDAGRGAETVIIGEMVVSATMGFTLDGVEVRNDVTTTGGFRGVSITGAGEHAILNSVFFSEVAGGPNAVGDWAIFTNALGTGEIVIDGNLFTGDESGKYDTASWNRAIWLNGGGIDRTVSNNVIEYARTAVNLEQAGQGTVSIDGNAVSTSGTGVSFSDPAPAAIDFVTDNTFDDVDTDFNAQNLTTGATFDIGGTGNASLSPSDTLLALGGKGSDVVDGTAGADAYFANPVGGTVDIDIFTGGAGDDVMFGDTAASGGAAVGEDVFVFSGPRSNYTVAQGVDPIFGQSALVVTDAVGGDGVDYLVGVGKAQFSDGVVRVFGAPDAVATDEGVPAPILVADLLANDIDANLDPLQIDTLFNGVGGTASLQDNGTPDDASDDFVLFTPNAGFSGEASFFYSVSDGLGVGDVVQVTVDVEPDAPNPDTQTIVVRAAGTGGPVAPQFNLVVDGEIVGTYEIGTPVTNQAASNGELVYEDFTYTYQSASGPSTVAVVYTNNGNDGPGFDRNLYVDNVTVNGAVLESEVDGVLTFPNGQIAGPTEFIYKNGTLSFDVPNDGGPVGTQTVVINAAGTGGPITAPAFEVIIDGESFGVFEIADPGTNQERRTGQLDFTAFEFTYSAENAPSEVVIAFANNGADPGGEDRNIIIDNIVINGTVLEAEIAGEVFKTNGDSLGSTEEILRNGTMVFDDFLIA
jgi:hypothetical protein